MENTKLDSRKMKRQQTGRMEAMKKNVCVDSDIQAEPLKHKNEVWNKPVVGSGGPSSWSGVSPRP